MSEDQRTIFCPKCESVMTREVFGQTHELEFVCGSCRRDPQNVIKARDVDVLIFDKQYKKMEFFPENVFINAEHDPTIPRTRVTCKRCAHPYMKGIRHMKSMRLVYYCAKPGCGNRQEPEQ